ncbi:MAG: hypothetical protein MJE77_36675 [Proteobacteria bacterium]|nr:hypothetical protein [Pseudomonadota bacterium]
MRHPLVTRVSTACLVLFMALANRAYAQSDGQQPDTPDDEHDDPARQDIPVVVEPSADEGPADPHAEKSQRGARASGDQRAGGNRQAGGDQPPALPDPAVQPVDPRALVAAVEGAREPPIDMPVMFNAPTGHLLPAGIVLSAAGVETGGGFNSDIRVGLGDVAEFGVGTNALVNVRQNLDAQPEALSYYPTALFKMGIAENLLFRFQPALALGFRKSFEKEHDDRKTRIAQLYLVASKSVGRRFRLHVGGVLWDASIKRSDGTELLFHDRGAAKQLRGFAGIEIEPLDRSQILLEVHYMPEFTLGDENRNDRISLVPTFSWGVRYELAKWALLESGVRIPDIKDVNLIEAQIFGQLRFVTRRFRKFLKSYN